MIDLMEQLITEKDLFGESTRLPVDEILNRTILSFCPNGNPFGREKAPVDCWDGSYCDNPRFWCWMRGEDPLRPNQMWERLDRFDTRKIKHVPDPIGIVYEQIDAFTYVEPNRSQESSYFKLFHHLDKQYAYEAWFDLHQCEEFSQKEYNCSILLASPEFGNPDKEPTNRAWAHQIIDAWKQVEGLTPDPVPFPLSYTGEQLAYFQKNWKPLHARMHILNSEVKNNAPEMTPRLQLKAQSLAIEASIRRLLD